MSDSNYTNFKSLVKVSLSFYLCEVLDCSGAISCVICGLLFSSFRDNAAKKQQLPDLEAFDSFWETADILLNSLLYVLLGLTLVRMLQMPMAIRLSLVAIILNFVARFVSIFIGTLFLGHLPDDYKKSSFSLLFTWGGLRGGLSVALAMSTADIEVYDKISKA